MRGQATSTQQTNSQQYTQTQNSEAYAYYNNYSHDQQYYNNQQAYNNDYSDNTDYNNSQSYDSTHHSQAPPSAESDDMDLQPRSYREYAEANYGDYAFPGNDASTYLPKKDDFEEETEEQEEGEIKTKKKKKKKEKADEPAAYDYTYYAKLFSKHVQADYIDSNFTYTADGTQKDSTQHESEPNTNSDTTTPQTNSTTDPTNPTSADPTLPTYPTNTAASDTTNTTDPPNAAESPATFDYNSLTPEQQQYILQYYQYYQQQTAAQSADSQQPSKARTERTSQPDNQPHDDTNFGSPENGAIDKANELLDMEYDATSQLYYLRKKGWYYDPSTALYPY
jgi:hypothetical protein